jgi:hypothetical protein
MFRDLQLSFLKASTPDGEIPTDHAILAILYKMADKFGIKHIISGMNFRNEGMLPPSWARGYLDWKYIKSVHKIFGSQSLNSYPHLSIPKFLYYNLIKGIRSVSFINYIDFNKTEAIKLIENELSWRNYGGKHYESIFTRFYQGYILPHKFGVDKRLLHYSTLVISGQMTREEAAKGLEGIPYNSQQDLDQDIKYFLKKMMWTDDDLKSYIGREGVSHNTYPTEEPIFRFIKNLLSDSLKKKIKKWLMK